MTEAPRKSISVKLRLPLALGVAGLMVTGSAAMAWPVLKTAFAPITSSSAATAPVDPAAVTGFVEMTRAQISPALADVAEIPEPTLASASYLMLDAAILRQPRMEPEVQPVEQAQQTEAPGVVGVPVQVVQAQTMRPAPRPTTAMDVPVTDMDRAVVASPAPTMRVVPTSSPRVTQSEASANQTRQRLLNMWISGAYR